MLILIQRWLNVINLSIHWFQEFLQSYMGSNSLSFHLVISRDSQWLSNITFVIVYINLPLWLHIKESSRIRLSPRIRLWTSVLLWRHEFSWMHLRELIRGRSRAKPRMCHHSCSNPSSSPCSAGCCCCCCIRRNSPVQAGGCRRRNSAAGRPVLHGRCSRLRFCTGGLGSALRRRRWRWLQQRRRPPSAKTPPTLGTHMLWTPACNHPASVSTLLSHFLWYEMKCGHPTLALSDDAVQPHIE